MCHHGCGRRQSQTQATKSARWAFRRPQTESDFKPCSYGFRQKRRAKDAIAEIHYLTSPTRDYHWVFAADIKACLKASVLCEDKTSRETITGTPWGRILSPLLANVSLSVLDEHFTRKWDSLGPARTRIKRRRAGEPVMRLVRYADNFVVLVRGTR